LPTVVMIHPMTGGNAFDLATFLALLAWSVAGIFVDFALLLFFISSGAAIALAGSSCHAWPSCKSRLQMMRRRRTADRHQNNQQVMPFFCGHLRRSDPFVPAAFAIVRW